MFARNFMLGKNLSSLHNESSLSSLRFLSKSSSSKLKSLAKSNESTSFFSVFIKKGGNNIGKKVNGNNSMLGSVTGSNLASSLNGIHSITWNSSLKIKEMHRKYAEETSEEEKMLVKDHKLTDEQAAFLKKNGNLLKQKVLMKIHPDKFNSFPAARELNEKTIKELNHFIDSMENYVVKLNNEAFDNLPSPIKLKYVFLNEKNEYRVVNETIYLPVHLIQRRLDVETDARISNMLQFYQTTVKQLAKGMEPAGKGKKK
eukprot:TRINITY_DN12906_c0_g1_i1.p1 TRINITY_DN12906_c0_g1~~TRINITY_DN12906_c0_g1_i1.p1  ORF type:complete len:258 (+),score=107.97 TRINITY_DN12906_c0_g1_i1:46-819(+)